MELTKCRQDSTSAHYQIPGATITEEKKNFSSAAIPTVQGNSLVKGTSHDRITLTNRSKYSKTHTKIEHSMQSQGFKASIIKVNSCLYIAQYTKKNYDTDGVHV